AQPITDEERRARIAKAQRLMTEQGIGAILLESGTSMRYFTGVSWSLSERTFALVLPARGEPGWICPAFEGARARGPIRVGGAGAGADPVRPRRADLGGGREPFRPDRRPASRPRPGGRKARAGGRGPLLRRGRVAAGRRLGRAGERHPGDGGVPDVQVVRRAG